MEQLADGEREQVLEMERAAPLQIGVDTLQLAYPNFPK